MIIKLSSFFNRFFNTNLKKKYKYIIIKLDVKILPNGKSFIHFVLFAFKIDNFLRQLKSEKKGGGGGGVKTQ